MINKFTLLICFFSIFVALSWSVPTYEREFETKDLEGYVVSEQSFSAKTSSFVFEDTSQNKFLVRTDKYLNYSYGDKIFISGKLKIPENFENENGIVFDYQNFLLKDNITHTTFFPEIQMIQKDASSSTMLGVKKTLFWAIFWLKEKLVLEAKRVFSSETSSLVLGILLGLKDSIDEGLEENFRRTGLIHILVLSGFNLTVIAYFVFKLLQKTHRNFRYVFSLLLIFIFVIMVGAGATVVRASIMISVFILSKLLRRNSNPNNALLLAASFMVLHNPMILLHDPSFQLSFVATMGLVNFYPLIEKVANKIIVTPAFILVTPLQAGAQAFIKILKEIIISNIAVQIAIIPLLAYMMGEFSIIAIIPNILVLPIIPIFMLISFLAIAVSFLGIGFHLPFVLFTEFLSNFMVWIVNFFGDLNFSTLKVILGWEYLAIIYLILISLIIYLQIREQIISRRRYNYLQ